MFFATGHARSCPGQLSCSCPRLRAVAVSAFVSFLISSLEITMGFHADSLALVADAAHTFSDGFAHGITAYAIIASYRNAKRAVLFDRRGLSVNAVLLGFSAAVIAVEATRRLFSPSLDVAGLTVMTVAGAALVGNVFQHYWLVRGSRHSEGNHGENTLTGLMKHIAVDIAQSAFVVAGGILIIVTGIALIDPLFSLVLVLIMLYQVRRLLQRAGGMGQNGHDHTSTLS